MSLDLSALHSWLEGDLDPQTQEEAHLLLQALTETEGVLSPAEFRERFVSDISLSSNGTFTKVEAGWARVNASTVARLTAGLVYYLNQTLAATREKNPPTVLVGFDGRASSPKLAAVAAAVAGGCGAQVLTFEEPGPTALLSFALGHLQAEAAIMISGGITPVTPVEFNGMRVFLGGRAVPPSENGHYISASIAAAISDLGRALPPPRDLPQNPSFSSIPTEVTAAFSANAQKLIQGIDKVNPNLKIAIMGCYGAGTALLRHCLEMAGFGDVIDVGDTCETNPSFGGLNAPDPRNPILVKASLAFAQDAGADLMLGISPDADRCIVALPMGKDRVWQILGSDDVSAIVTSWFLERRRRGEIPLSSVVAYDLYCASMPLTIAQSAGVKTAVTLGGVATLTRVPNVGLSFTQSDSYCVNPGAIHCADGISASLIVAALAASSSENGLLQILNDAANKHGVHLATREDIVFDSLGAVERYSRRLRQGHAYPQDFSGSHISGWCDMAKACPHKAPCAIRATVGHPKERTNAVVGLGAKGERVIIRPRPNRNQISIYVEVDSEASDPSELGAARSVALRRATEIVSQVRACMQEAQAK